MCTSDHTVTATPCNLASVGPLHRVSPGHDGESQRQSLDSYCIGPVLLECLLLHTTLSTPSFTHSIARQARDFSVGAFDSGKCNVSPFGVYVLFTPDPDGYLGSLVSKRYRRRPGWSEAAPRYRLGKYGTQSQQVRPFGRFGRLGRLERLLQRDI